MARIEIERLTKEFTGTAGGKVRAVSELSFSITEGEWLVLVGPSGSGKTTTLRMIAGLEEPTSGTISLDGRCLNQVPARERNLAMVFQQAALYPHLSLFDNLAFGLRIRRVAKPEIQERVRTMAALLGLSECLGRMPYELSGGQRQRVALGRALVRRPRVLLLDEPLSNLDLPTRTTLRRELLELRKGLGVTVLYVTHDQHEAMTFATRLGVLRNGKLQQIGAPRELYEQPANVFVAGFLGSPSMNFLRGTVGRDANGIWLQTDGGGGKPLRVELGTPTGMPALPVVNEPVVLGIRPENLTINSGPGQVVEAVVEAIEELGADKHVYVVAGSEKLVARVPGSLPVHVNDKLGLHLDLRAAHLFHGVTEEAIR